MRFYLGSHRPWWLTWISVPLFVSHRTLRDYVNPPRAKGPWALDSGGFTELSTHGKWTISEREYVDAVRRYHDEIGKMDWAAPQDWMCEPWITDKTGLTVREHQERTVQNFLTLTELDPDLPFIPVLQGWERDDYLAGMDLYQEAGVNLLAYPAVGLGSVCRRQHTAEIGEIVRAVGLPNLHGFGVKKDGLLGYGHLLASADSMAWSIAARNNRPLPGCTHSSCANCFIYALTWRVEIMRHVEKPRPKLRPAWSPPNQERLAV